MTVQLKQGGKWAVVLISFISMISSNKAVYAESISLIQTHPSDPSAFTQGLEINPHTDQLLIGTGQYGESVIGYLDLETGTITEEEPLAEKYFGEGITVTPNSIWQLTWKSGTAFQRDPEDLSLKSTVDYQGEGWGLAYDSDQDVLWMSDGSDTLSKRDPDTFELLDTLKVTHAGEKMDQINELEYANQAIYANIWYSNEIVQINPATGKVEHTYDMTDILKSELSDDQLEEIDTLNGIAHIEDNRFYVTGKLYPTVFEVELEK